MTEVAFYNDNQSNNNCFSTLKKQMVLSTMESFSQTQLPNNCPPTNKDVSNLKLSTMSSNKTTIHSKFVKWLQMKIVILDKHQPQYT